VDDDKAPGTYTSPAPDHEAWTVRCPPSTSWRHSWTHNARALGAGNVDVNAGELIAETVQSSR
jgi:hypothetical protein